MKVIDEKQKIIQCTQCGRNTSQLKLHMKIHLQPDMVCAELAEFEFEYLNFLHLRTTF